MDLPFLEYAFRSQDRRGNGECSFEDFADAVIQMRNTEVGPVVSFLRLQMAEVLDEVSTLSDQIQAVGRDISSHISQVGEQAAHKISTIPRHAPPQQPPPDIATTLFGGSWWTTLGAGDHDEGDFDYFDQGNPNNHRAPYLPQQVNMFDDDHSPAGCSLLLGVLLGLQELLSAIGLPCFVLLVEVLFSLLCFLLPFCLGGSVYVSPGG